MQSVWFFFEDVFENKISRLAPIELEILLYRFSGQKIARDSGTKGVLKTKTFCFKKKLNTKMPTKVKSEKFITTRIPTPPVGTKKQKYF